MNVLSLPVFSCGGNSNTAVKFPDGKFIAADLLVHNDLVARYRLPRLLICILSQHFFLATSAAHVLQFHENGSLFFEKVVQFMITNRFSEVTAQPDHLYKVRNTFSNIAIVSV